MRCATRRMNRYCHSHANHFSIDGFVWSEERWKAVLCVCMLEAREKLLKRFPWTHRVQFTRRAPTFRRRTPKSLKLRSTRTRLLFDFRLGNAEDFRTELKKLNTCAWLTFNAALAREFLRRHKSRFEVKLFDWGETYWKDKEKSFAS